MQHRVQDEKAPKQFIQDFEINFRSEIIMPDIKY